MSKRAVRLMTLAMVAVMLFTLISGALAAGLGENGQEQDNILNQQNTSVVENNEVKQEETPAPNNENVQDPVQTENPEEEEKLEEGKQDEELKEGGVEEETPKIALFGILDPDTTDNNVGNLTNPIVGLSYKSGKGLLTLNVYYNNEYYGTEVYKVYKPGHTISFTPAEGLVMQGVTCVEGCTYANTGWLIINNKDGGVMNVYLANEDAGDKAVGTVAEGKLSVKYDISRYNPIKLTINAYLCKDDAEPELIGSNTFDNVKRAANGMTFSILDETLGLRDPKSFECNNCTYNGLVFTASDDCTINVYLVPVSEQDTKYVGLTITRVAGLFELPRDVSREVTLSWVEENEQKSITIKHEGTSNGFINYYSVPTNVPITITAVMESPYTSAEWTCANSISQDITMNGYTGTKCVGNPMTLVINERDVTSMTLFLSGGYDSSDTTYDLTYHLNGGDGENEVVTYPENTVVSPLADGSELTHAQREGKEVVFIGWTLEQFEDIFSRNDAAPNTINSVTLDEDKTVYAAWGYDENGNGKPDVTEDKYSLTYDLNGGSGGPNPNPVNGLLVGETVLLNATAPTHADQGDTKVVFAGWTATKVESILTGSDARPSYLTQVTMGAANKTVYAAWGLDTNDDGTADVNQYKLTINYTTPAAVTAPTAHVDYLNQGDSYSVVSPAVDGHTPNIATVAGTMPANAVTVNVTYTPTGGGTETEYFKLTYNNNGGIGGPGEIAGLGAQLLVHLNHTPLPTHAAADDGTPILFAGWLGTKDAKIYTKDDVKPTYLTQITMDRDKTVYAVWGLDSNGNGIPDVNETKYTLTYDANGGTGGPDQVTGLLPQNGYELNDTVKPTHAQQDGKNVLFMGWLAADNNGKVYTKNDTAPAIIETVDIAANVTVYAAWGLDTNGNEIPDVKEDKYNLTYNGNARDNGTVDGVPTDNSNYITGETAILSHSEPTHSQVNGTDVLFIGWTASPINKILSKEDSVPNTISSVTFAEANITVHAAWGFDTNGNEIPDVMEAYTLTWADSLSETIYGTARYLFDERIVPIADPTKASYTFNGWQPEVPERMQEGDLRVEAQWIFNGGPIIPTVNYSVTYDANGATGGTVPVDGNLYAANANVSVKGNEGALVRTQAVFLGFSQTRNGLITTQEAEDASGIITGFQITRDTTLHAVWAIDENENGVPDYKETDIPDDPTPGGDEPGTDDPGTDDPGTDDPGTDDPGTDIPDDPTPGGDKPGDNPGGTTITDEETPLGDLPTTGDSGNVALLVAILLLAGGGIAAILLDRKRRA